MQQDSSGVHPAIIALLRDLPHPENPWTEEQRERFIAAFKAVVQHVYPAQEVPASGGDSQ